MTVSKLGMPKQRVSAWLLLVTGSLALGFVLAWLGLPAGFLLGPMVVAVLMAIFRGALPMPRPVFQLAQTVVGCMIARTITLPILHEIGQDWPVFVAGVLSVILVSLVIGWVLTRWQVMPGPTAIWGTSPGAAIAMTLMSADYGADERLVAFMQYSRVMVVAVAASALAAYLAPMPAGSGVLSGWFEPLPIVSFGATLAIVALAYLLGRRLRFGAAPLILAIVLGALAQNVLGLDITLPEPLLALSYLLIGWTIGMRFTRATLAYAVKALPAVIGSIAILVVMCAGIAWLLVIFAGVDPLTAYLATSPGGADTVAIIASSTHVDVAYVMAMQMARFLAVMFIGPPLAQLMTRWSGYGPVKRANTRS